MTTTSSTSTTIPILFISIIICSISFSNATCNNISDNAGGCIYNQTLNFVNSVRSVIQASRDAISVIMAPQIDMSSNVVVQSNHNEKNDEFGLSNAIHDCVELLDDSIDYLHLSINESSGIPCKGTSSPCTTISVALANHEQCMEGLFDIRTENTTIKNMVIEVISPLQSMMTQLLTLVNPQTTTTTSINNNNVVLTNQRYIENFQFEQEQPNVTVALDGTGQYTKIMDAVKAAPDYSRYRFVIRIKKGIYKEIVTIDKQKTNLVMIGEGQNMTIITGNRSYTSGYKTYHTATIVIGGCGFMASNITFQNTAGPEGRQAVAMRSNADNLVFYRCTFNGYQDTLYARAGIQFYRECDITGTVDFIFGDATAVFQKCNILVKKPMNGQYNTITAQGRVVACSESGYSFIDCNFTKMEKFDVSIETYLGRPWRNHSRTVVMKSSLDDMIHKEGWMDWDGRLEMESVYYGEYKNNGPGANVCGRVKLSGFHVIVNESEAMNFTVGRFIDGDEWLKSTGVNYTSGL